MNDMSPLPADGTSQTDASSQASRASIVADRKYLGLLIGGVSTLGFAAFLTAMVASGRSGEMFRAEESRKFEVRHDQLNSTRHKAANAIGSYAIVDAKAGRYKIPVERAMEVVARDPDLLRAPVPKAAAPAGQPAAASAEGAGSGDAVPAEGTTANDNVAPDEAAAADPKADAAADTPAAQAANKPAADGEPAPADAAPGSDPGDNN